MINRANKNAHLDDNQTPVVSNSRISINRLLSLPINKKLLILIIIFCRLLIVFKDRAEHTVFYEIVSSN